MSAIANGLLGRTLFGIDGQKIGRITAIYVNSATGTSEWVAVRTHGLIGAKVVFAPVALVVREGDRAVVTFDKQHVRHAPRARTEGALSPAESDRLYRHYGIDPDPAEVTGSHAASWVAH